MIAQYVENGKNTWDRTPELSLAINTSVSYKLGSHGYPDPGPGTATSPQNPSERAERLKEVFLIVQKHLQKASREQGRHYSLRRRTWKPEMGSLVLVRQHHLSKAIEGFAAKLAPKFDGPYKVVAFPSPNVVRIRLPGQRKGRLANIGDLRSTPATNPDSAKEVNRPTLATGGDH